MKKLSYTLAIIVAGTLGLTTLTQARDYGHAGAYGRSTPQHRIEDRVDRRQAKQWDRINNGIDSGDLSRREAKRLLKNQRKIARMEHRFERDGYYSPRERRIMERALDRASHRIKRAKHNDHGRPYGHRNRAWHGDSRRHGFDPYAYQESDDTYVVGTSSSTTITAQADGFSVSWNTSDQQ